MARIKGNPQRWSPVDQQSALLSTINNASQPVEADRESSSNENAAHRSLPPISSSECPLQIQYYNLSIKSQNIATQIADLQAMKTFIDKQIVDLQDYISKDSVAPED